MKKYKDRRTTDDMKENLEKLGYQVPANSKQKYQHGSDYLMFQKGEDDCILLNTVTGVANIRNEQTKHMWTTTSSLAFDNEKWFQDILDALYVPLEES